MPKSELESLLESCGCPPLSRTGLLLLNSIPLEKVEERLDVVVTKAERQMNSESTFSVKDGAHSLQFETFNGRGTDGAILSKLGWRESSEVRYNDGVEGRVRVERDFRGNMEVVKEINLSSGANPDNWFEIDLVNVIYPKVKEGKTGSAAVRRMLQPQNNVYTGLLRKAVVSYSTFGSLQTHEDQAAESGLLFEPNIPIGLVGAKLEERKYRLPKRIKENEFLSIKTWDGKQAVGSLSREQGFLRLTTCEGFEGIFPEKIEYDALVKDWEKTLLKEYGSS